MSEPLVSLSILNYNGKKYLKKCLDSALAQTYPHVEIVVTDNGSTDGSVEYIQQHYPTVKIIQSPVNIPLVGYNIGIKNSRGDYVAVLNNDIELDKNWAKEMVAFFTSHDQAGMCTGKILYMEEPDTLNIGGVNIRKDGSVTITGENEKDDGRFDETKEVFTTCNAGAIYKKAMLDQTGLFDEDFWLYYEEVDLSWRAYRLGWTCWYHPKAIMYHERGGTEGRFPIRRVYIGERNRIWTNIKNMPLSLLIPSFFYSIRRIAQQKETKKGYLKDGTSTRTIIWTLTKAWLAGTFCSWKMLRKRRKLPGKLDVITVKKLIH